MPRLSTLLLGLAGLVGGALLGLVLGAALGIGHLYVYKSRGGEAAGTEIALVFVYAIPGTIIGAVAGLTGGLLLGRRR